MLTRTAVAMMIGSTLLFIARRVPTAQAQSGAELRQVFDVLYQTRSAGDGAAWARHATADYVITHSDGKMHNRLQEAAEIEATGPRQRVELDESRLHIYGNTVIHTASYRGRATRATDVWVTLDYHLWRGVPIVEVWNVEPTKP